MTSRSLLRSPYAPWRRLLDALARVVLRPHIEKRLHGCGVSQTANP